MVAHVGSLGPEFLGSYLIGRAYIRTRGQFLELCRWTFWAIILMLPLTVMEKHSVFAPPDNVQSTTSGPEITSADAKNAAISAIRS